MIWRIWKMLGLEAKSRPKVVDFAPFPMNAGVKKVPCVELNSGLRSPYFKNPSATGVVKPCCHRQRLRLTSSQSPVVVVALAKLQLLIVTVDTRPNGRRRRKIKRCSLNFPELARRNQSSIRGRKSIRGDHQPPWLLQGSVPIPPTAKTSKLQS